MHKIGRTMMGRKNMRRRELLKSAAMVDMTGIQAAERRIAPHIVRTPVVQCRVINQWLGANFFFKCENLQRAGAFKSRGACNAVFSLPDDLAARGVVTHSSGNHAAALSRAAQRRGIPAWIVMPSDARQQKIDKVRKYGGQITFCEPTLAARESTADAIVKQTGATLIHPYDDDRIIAGQATAAVELLSECSHLDIVVTPVGGGGLLSGTAVAAKAIEPNIEVWGAEPEGADDAFRSWQSGHLVPSVEPKTIADGLLTSLGRRTFPIIRRLVDNILLASDLAILDAVYRLHDDANLVVEPSGAVPLAAIAGNRALIAGKNVGIILSGGNITMDSLPPRPGEEA